VEADDCPERTYVVLDKGSVHGPAWPHGEPRSTVMMGASYDISVSR
jgi:hypothetical protein